MKNFSTSVTTLVLSIGNTVLRGYVLTLLWVWFVVSQFPQMPHLHVVPAIGLMYVLSLLHMRGIGPTDWQSIKEMDEDQKSGFRILQGALETFATLSLWLGGWIVHLFM